MSFAPLRLSPLKSRPWLRPAAALSLASLYSLAYTLSGAVVFWSLGASVSDGALSQTPLPPTEAPQQRPTTLQLVEEARQRLRDRGELPAAPANSTPAVVNPVVPPVPMSPPVNPFESYRLGVGDAVAVVVQRFPDLNFQAVIDQEGMITTPLLGRVSLRGLTVSEAQERIRQGVSRFVIDPIVLLALTRERPVQVTITGEISRPGTYFLTSSAASPVPRLSSALLAAGGATSNADLRAIQVRRPLQDGSTVDRTLDLVTPLKEGTALPELRLQDGDVVFLPKLAPGAEQTYDRGLVSRSTLVKPQITIRILSYANGGLANVVLPSGSTFLDALTASRSNPDSANLRRIALVRFDPQQGKAITHQIDGKKALMGDVAQNLPLEDNDVIVIGRNLVGRITYALNVFTQPFRDVLGFLLFFRQLGDAATNLFNPTNSD